MDATLELIDPHEEAAAVIAALPPQPLSFAPGVPRGLDYNEVMDFLRCELVASLGIPPAILVGDSNYSGRRAIEVER